MRYSLLFIISIGLFFLISCKEDNQLAVVQEMDGLVALWDFKEESGTARMAIGKGDFPLKEMNGEIQRIPEGPCLAFLH